MWVFLPFYKNTLLKCWEYSDGQDRDKFWSREVYNQVEGDKNIHINTINKIIKMVKRDLFEEEAFQQTFNELREHVCNEMKVFKVKDSENKANDEAYAWCV